MANNTTNKLSILLDASVFGTTGTAKQVVSGAGAALGGERSAGAGAGAAAAVGLRTSFHNSHSSYSSRRR